MRGGDACVALAGEEWRSWEEDEGDASVPTPAPTGTKALLKQCHKIPTPRVSLVPPRGWETYSQ